MRDCRVSLILGAFFLSILAPLLTMAHAQSTAEQPLFLGDRTCLDDVWDCPFARTVALHPYLHVVLRDQPGNDDWRVQAGATCSETSPEIAGGQPIGQDGYLETVVDLSAAPSAVQLLGAPACYVFRGRHGWAVTFYAAYFDDRPTPDADQVYPGYQALTGRPDLPDLDVTYIHRAPVYPYDAAKNAPSPGDSVTFEAHVRNAGGQPAPPFQYTWTLDHDVLVRGGFPTALAPAQEVTIRLRWRWQGGPHDLTFRLHATSDQISTPHDRLTIRTNALALGFWVEQDAYQYFRDHQWEYCQTLACAGSDSFEDWLQRQVLAWNLLLARSQSPLAPAGAADRVRLDELTVVPDGSLPLHGGLATNSPDSSDHTVDLEWGLPARDVARSYHLNWEGPFDVDWSTIHELNHARSLADLYRFDVPMKPGNTVAVTALDGAPVWNSARPFDQANKITAFSTDPKVFFLYQNREQDLMSCPCTPTYSAYSVVLLNRLRGRRARCGNTNPPCNLGDWFTEIPPLNELRILDATGSLLPDGSQVRLFFDLGTGYTDHIFQQSQNETLRVRGGVVSLGPDPFQTHGSTRLAGHNLLLIEVRSGDVDRFCFQEPTDFNLAYWTGYRDLAHPAGYTLRLNAISGNGCNLQLPRALVNEPFATSPDASRVRLGPRSGSARTAGRILVVRLRDDARPPIPMRNRYVEVESRTGRILAAGTTDSHGILRLKLRGNVTSFRIIDATDNDLSITGHRAVPPP